MKKYVVLVISMLLILFCYKVEAKDTVCTLNKYEEEELNYILQEDKDSFIVSGIYKDKDDILKPIVIKYNSKGKIQWKYQYQNEINSEVKGLIHNYNQEENYLLVIKEDNESPKFLIITKEGELKQEVQTSLPANTIIEKVLEVGNEGYLIVGQKENKAFLSKYDNNLNLVWSNDYSIDNSKVVDIIYLENDAYYGIIEIINEEKKSYELLKYDLSGQEINTIKTNFESEEAPHLFNSKDSYIVYGITKEVKLSKNKIGSYYLIKYNLQDTEEWETVGDTPTTDANTLKVHSDEKNYYVMSTNDNDNSIEVVKITDEGIIKEKIKKLKTSYYKMNDFIFENDNLYFIGQINCPEEDNCDYKANSLFLVCSEDKVIEVKDNDSKNIMIGTLVVVGFAIILYLVRKKKKLSINK